MLQATSKAAVFGDGSETKVEIVHFGIKECPEMCLR